MAHQGFRLFIIAAALLWGAVPPCAAAPSSDHRTLMVDGLNRSYQIYIPAQSPATRRAALILLHDSADNASTFRHYTQFDNVAAAAGIIAVYPQANEDFWSGDKAADSRFLQKLIETLVHDDAVDPERVYIGGMAAGGVMALRFACGHAAMVAGLAVVAATAPANEECKPERPLPMIIIHGTADSFAPLEGGTLLLRGGVADGQLLSLDKTLAGWLEIDDCHGAKTRPILGVRLRHDGLTIKRTTYRECNQAAVESILVEGGGHTWPGARQNFFTNQVLGAATRQIDAGATIWAFFQAAENDPE